MDDRSDSEVLSEAGELYTKAVQDTPPNRTMFDNLVDLIQVKPFLLYESFFDKGYEAAAAVIDVCHGGPDAQEDDNLSFLTPPAAWGWATMEEAVCRVPPQPLFESQYPGFIRRFLELANKTLKHRESTPAPIVRRVIQALTRFWPELIQLCLRSNPEDAAWRERYMEMMELDRQVQQLINTLDDPALGVHLVKHQETVIAMFTELPQGDSNGYSELIDLGHIPDSHPYVDKAALVSRAASAKQQLIQLLPNSDNLRLYNMSFITALINSMFYLMSLRSQLCGEFIEKLMEWYEVINSSEQGMTNAQLVMIGKTVRILLLHLHLQSHMGAYSEMLESKLDKIGGQEWSGWLDRKMKQDQREQRERERQERQMNRQRPGESGGQKRRPREDDDNDDEEKQARMLEENAKRVKLDNVSDEASAAAAALAAEETVTKEAAIQAAQLAAGTETDVELAEQLKMTLPELAFDIQPMDALSPDARDALFVEALKRVVAAGSVVQKFVARNRLQALGASTQPPSANSGSGNVTESGDVATLSNGISTNAGILEDSILMLVRLICSCYVMSKDLSNSRSEAAAAEVSAKWGKVHECAESVLESIVAAPRERYGLGILLLYEIWMAVVILDPELGSSPIKQVGKSEAASSALALYLRWSDRIFDAVIQCGMDTTLNQKAAATTAAAIAAAESASAAVAGPNASAPPPPQQQQQLAPPPQPLQQPDRLILNYVLDAPYIPSIAIKKLEVCLRHADTAMLGYATLEKAMELRPPVVEEGMRVLLTNCGHHERTTRIGCIRAVKKYYTTSAQTSTIENWARMMLKVGIDNAVNEGKKVSAEAERVLNEPVEPLEPGMDEAQVQAANERAIEKKKAAVIQVHKKGDTDIEACLVKQAELLLALCTRNMDLYVDVLTAYATAPPPVQSVLRRVVTPLVKSVAATPGKIVPALAKFSSGAESLVLRTVFILASEGPPVPGSELVGAVTELCDTHGLDARFIVFIANGLGKDEALQRLGSVLALLNGRNAQWPLVSEFYARLTTPYTSSPSVLSPMELLLALHKLASDGAAPMNKVLEGLDVFVHMRKPDGTFVFSTQVISAALKVLAEEPVVSPLMLRTAELYFSKRGGLAGTVTGYLEKFVERSVWDMPEPVFMSFAHCFLALLPGSLSLVKHIPSEALRKMVMMLPALEAPVRAYVGGMNESVREKFSWLFAAASNEGRPQ
ncbi:hypothetical protein H4S07_000858 [Coemansia furcata]|uniref:Uncharacterized protein n=1 Tax=Coemansia furcata TaxID=417177 RepID=A0ACC1LQY0_9FUNG|nr:hypothetical protein H4S07_000858 [Coemansia furcata]